jgi:release factor glutamine methyltransferase
MTVRDALLLGTDKLKAAGLDGSRLEAEILLGWALGLDRAGLYVNSTNIVPKSKLGKYRKALSQRTKRRPWQYITGQTEFYGLNLRVNKAVLIPRPETELLAEQVISRWRKEWTTALDIGTGSGALALALAQRLNYVKITACDYSSAALRTAKSNAARLNLTKRVRFVKADLFPRTSGKFNCIVSNPPYIPSKQILGLQPEVSLYEPRQALDGGRDGLDFYRRIAKALKNKLKPGGLLALEVGKGQAIKVCSILKKGNPDFLMEVVKDYAGINRMVFANRVSK